MLVIELMSAFVPLAAVVAVLVWCQHSRVEKIVQQWAKTAGLELVSAQKRYWRTGPFSLRQFRGQFVFRIVVRDHAGAERTGWILVGGPVAGVLSDKVEAIWDS
jgi:hypothetical protein